MAKTCVIDAGGGFRGIYAAAVLDRCLDEGISFDLGIGISAGSANIASFLSRQKGRNYRFYTVYGKRWQYASLRNFLTKRSYIDMDYVYGTLSNSNGEDPMDYNAFMDNPMDFIVVATKAETAEAIYIPKRQMKRDAYDVFEASSAILGICRPHKAYNIAYFDGALKDLILVRVLYQGCDKVVVLLTKPRDFIRKPDGDERLARLMRKRYPKAAEALRKRAENYNKD